MSRKKIVVEHLCGFRFSAENESQVRIVIDGESPPVGLRPMELLLASLGSCTAYDVVSIMKKKRTPLARYRVEVEGERAETHPKRYTKIVVRHIGSGPGVTEKALRHAAELSHEKFCSVSANLNAEIEVQVVVEPWEEDSQS